MPTEAVSCVLVDAPDGAAALALEQRLERLTPATITITHSDHWFVEFDAVEDLPALEASVRGWLRELGAAETHMHINGRDVRVSPSVFEHRRHRASNGDLIG
jgi:hypothetical protein